MKPRLPIHSEFLRPSRSRIAAAIAGFFLAFAPTAEAVYRPARYAGAQCNALLHRNAIEPLQVADTQWLRTFVERQRNEQYKKLGMPKEEGLDADLAKFEDAYRKKDGEIWVIKDAKGKIVGSAALIRIDAKTAEIRKFYLAESLQGSGAADDLMVKIVDHAHAKGFDTIRLETYRKWERAQSFYRKWEFEDFVPYFEHDARRDVWMQLKVGGKPVAEKVAATTADKAKYFGGFAKAIRANREEFRRVLMKVNTSQGADYEIRQALDTLDNVDPLEMTHLHQLSAEGLENVVVYGSTNIPLYTLVLHAILPASVAKNVWFRTPEASRHVYVELFELLKRHTGEENVAGIHLLTDPRDIQYDNFLKQYVMGVNPKGNKVLRKPSEVVLFTGSPETGREILQQIQSKFAELPAIKPGTKFQFLGFGAGMNPMVVTKDVGDNLDSAVEAALDSVRINMGQDCIAPNFYLVHRDVSPEFVRRVVAKAGPMPADRLSLSKNLDRLRVYREKYAKYLLNPEATLDLSQNVVSPHVFVFPFEMFDDVDLQEHFGPFLTIFSYKGIQDVERMALDTRVQRKAMYATVFGPKATSVELTKVSQKLQQYRLSVTPNQSIYADESGNMIFGGAGEDASLRYTLIKKEDGTVVTRTSHQPLVFSADANAFFVGKRSTRPPLQDRSYFKSEFVRTLAEARMSPDRLRGIRSGWEKLAETQPKLRGRGLKHIRDSVAKHGLKKVVVVDQSSLTPADLLRLEQLHGTPIIPIQRGKPGPLRTDSAVVLHISMPEDGPLLLNSVRGAENPHLGYGSLGPILMDNKFVEYTSTEAIWPGIMPPTESLAAMKKAGHLSPSLDPLRNEARYAISEAFRQGAVSPELEQRLVDTLEKLVSGLFGDVRKYYPEGAYFKNFDEFATADLGIQITSFANNPKRIVEQFMGRLRRTLLDRSSGWDTRANWLDEAGLKTLLVEPYETGTRFLNKLIAEPDDLLVQGKVEIAKSPLGQSLEFRVDFLEGDAVYVRSRFGDEFLPEEMAAAKRVIDDFFAKAPDEFRYSSGGADVARLANGEWKIIEFNYGPSSGTWMANYFPIESNELVSLLSGRDSFLMKELKTAYQGGFATQKAYLQRLTQIKPLWDKNSLEQLSRIEVFKWIRNRMLASWAKGKKGMTADQLLDHLRRLADGLSDESDPEVRRLLQGAESFVRSRKS